MLEEILLKKAKGYKVTETVQEYAIDEDGNKRLLKEKVAKKNIPPDLSALKAYMEIADDELNGMSDEELEMEKKRLINSLEKGEDNGKEYKGTDRRDKKGL